MGKMSVNELRWEIAEIISEAKKKKDKAEKMKKEAGKAAAAYGYYDEAFDFSEPLGEFNHIRAAGAVNWGPYTNSPPKVEVREGVEEAAVRQLVREVLDLSFISEESAWDALQESPEQLPDNIWERAAHFWEKTEDLKKDNKEIGTAAKKDKKGKK